MSIAGFEFELLFEYPAALLLLVPVLFLLLEIFFRSGIPSGRRILLICLRTGTAVLLTAAIAGPLSSGTSALHTIILLDRSDSTASASIEVLDNLQKLLLRKNGESPMSLISFGEDSVVEYERVNPEIHRQLRGEISRNHTNIESALYSAAAVAGSAGNDADARIILITDGRENAGDSRRGAAMLRDLSLSVDSILTSPVTRDAAVTELKTPVYSAPGASHYLDVQIRSSYSFDGTLQFHRNGEVLGEASIQVADGRNYYRYYYRLEDAGMHLYEVYLLGSDDLVPQNDYGRAYITVPGGMSILYVRPEPESAAPLQQALETQGFAVELIGPEELPSDLARYLQWKGIIFDNVPSSRVPYGSMLLIDHYVKRLGGGFVMIGGEKSFGPGGYLQTPIERILPVDMDISSPFSTPALTLLILVDKSGSMGNPAMDYRDKIDILKQSVVSAVQVLNPYYSVGILSFDADTEWTVPITKAGNSTAIIEYLKKLSPGGGTRMYPAMEEAFEALLQDGAQVRHLLIVSDGLVDSADYSGLARRMASQGITISTVAVGKDADTGLMREIADTGAGRFYAAASIEEAPRIFATESMMISRTLIFEETFFPSIDASHPVVSGIETMPPLLGCVLTYTKDEARQVITGPENYPLLSLRSYGTGRSAAFTSDLSGRWSADFVSDSSFPKFAGQLLRWITSGAVQQPMYVSISDDGSSALIGAELRGPRGEYINGAELSASSFSPGLLETVDLLDQTAPGRYEGSIPLSESEDTFISISSSDGAYAEHRVNVIPYSSELMPSVDQSAGFALLRDLAEMTGGSVIEADELDTAGETLFAERTSASAASTGPRTRLVLILSALFFYLSELTIRILNLLRKARGVPKGNPDRTVPEDTFHERSLTNRDDLSFWFGREYGKKSG